MKFIYQESAIYNSQFLVIGYQITKYKLGSDGIYKPIENKKYYF